LSYLASILSRQITNIPSSPIRAIFEKASMLESQGEKLIRLDIGSPNFKAPVRIIEDVCHELNSGNHGYSSNWGTLSLRKTISQGLHHKWSSETYGDDEILITNGASEAVALVIFSLLNGRDEILIPTPAWPHYISCAELFSKNYKEITTKESQEFKLTPELLEESISPQSKVLIINSPCNPTGVVYSPLEFRKIVDICKKNNIIIILDEIYENINYESQSTLMQQFSDKEDFIYINGFSKNYGMTGFRLGYIAASSTFLSQAIKFHQFLNVCGQGFVQEACVSFLQDEESLSSFAESVIKKLKPNRDKLIDFSTNNKIRMTTPNGAFYSFIRIPDSFDNAAKFCLKILEQEKITLVPGNAFGSSYDKYFRLSFGSVNTFELGSAIDSLKKYY